MPQTQELRRSLIEAGDKIASLQRERRDPAYGRLKAIQQEEEEERDRHRLVVEPLGNRRQVAEKELLAAQRSLAAVNESQREEDERHAAALEEMYSRKSEVLAQLRAADLAEFPLKQAFRDANCDLCAAEKKGRS